MTHSTIAAILLVALVSALLAAFTGAAAGNAADGLRSGAGCAPDVARALSAAAATGARRDITVIRSDAAGIRWPGRLADFSCLERLLDFGPLDVHADINGLLDRILGGTTNRVCNEAARLHAEASDRPWPPALFDIAVPPSADPARGSRR